MLAVTARSLEATQDLHDDHQREAVSAAIGRPRYAEFAAVIEQAIDRGEVSADCDVALMSRVFPALASHQVAAWPHRWTPASSTRSSTACSSPS